VSGTSLPPALFPPPVLTACGGGVLCSSHTFIQSHFMLDAAHMDEWWPMLMCMSGKSNGFTKTNELLLKNPQIIFD
jgi:hypothetical protein